MFCSQLFYNFMLHSPPHPTKKPECLSSLKEVTTQSAFDIFAGPLGRPFWLHWLRMLAACVGCRHMHPLLTLLGGFSTLPQPPGHTQPHPPVRRNWQAEPGTCLYPILSLTCASKLSTSPSKSQSVPAEGTSPWPGASGPGPTFLDATLTTQPSAHRMQVSGTSGLTVTQPPQIMCPVSLLWPPHRDRPVNQSYFWLADCQEGSAYMSLVAYTRYSPCQRWVGWLE